MPKRSRLKRWKYTNPETLETYLFEKLPNGTVRTVEFLGWRCPSGKLIKQ